MSGVAQCSACGAGLAPDSSAQGVCPACLLKLGLSSTTIPNAELPPAPGSASAAVPPPSPAAPSRLRRGGVLWGLLAIAAAAILIIAFAMIVLRRSGPLDVRVVRFSVSPSHTPRDFAVSPDGRRLAFAAEDAQGNTILWIHRFDSFIDQPLPAADDASAPFWSPDSRAIGFFSRGKLKHIDVATGAAVILCDAPSGRDGTWSRDGTIMFGRNRSGVLFRVSAHGGTPLPATTIDSSNPQRVHRWPHFLPDGRHFLYTSIADNPEHDAIVAASLDTGAVARLATGRSAAVSAERFLVFIRDGILMAQPFDSNRLESVGDARPLRFADRVKAFSVSENGVLAYQRGEEADRTPLASIDRSGRMTQVFDDLTGVGQFGVSPDGRTLAVSRRGDIWLSDVRRVTSRFTFDPADDTDPVWSPDGSRLVFVSDRGGRRGLYQKKANGAGKEELLFTAPDVESIDSWSPDGRFIVYTSRDERGKSGLWAHQVEGDQKPFPIQSPFNVRQGHLSPDGRWLAYVSDESGKDEVYVQAFPGPDGKWQVSARGGTNPRWRRDGRELFFVSAEKTLTAVAVASSGSALEFSVPRALFAIRRSAYEASPDGRFLIFSPEEDKPSMPIDVVINWASELER